MENGFDALGRTLFYTMLNAVDEVIHVVDKNGVTVFYNRAAAQLDFLDPSEVIGKHILDVYPSLNPETSTLLRVLKTGKPILNQQQTYVTKKGGVVTIVSSTFPLIADGEVVGAVDVSKNVTRIKELSQKLIDLQLELSQRRGRAPSTGVEHSAMYTFADIVGQDPGMQAVKAIAQKAARSNSTVLVYGETGTGKELLVQAIHNASHRASAPFIAQNCAALPESLVEGLLFGTVRGAFTGAEDRPGLFELANGGTLYLDEVNSLALDLQAKLLRVLQDGKVRRVGDTKVRPVDVRIVSSTNVRPEEAMAIGKLRADLYYRLNVVYIEIPPLRERRGDIPILVQHFISKCNQKLGSRVTGVAPETLNLFMRYDWPGNVREMEHVIEAAAVAIEGGLILPCHLPGYFRETGAISPEREVSLTVDGSVPVRTALKEAERRMILEALEGAGGNISRAARKLGIPRQTLQRKLKSILAPQSKDGPRGRPSSWQSAARDVARFLQPHLGDGKSRDPILAGRVARMKHPELIDSIVEAVLTGDTSRAVEATKRALKDGVGTSTILEEGLAAAMQRLGEMWDNGEAFLPEVLAAANAFRACAEVVESAEERGSRRSVGRCVLGTVRGDLHDLGKNIVGIMMRTAGFEVFDMGKDVPAERFVEAVRELKPQVLGLSALLSTTMGEQRVVIDRLERENLRGLVKVMVGGAPVTERWASEIGADAYAANAQEAVMKAKAMLGVK